MNATESRGLTHEEGTTRLTHVEPNRLFTFVLLATYVSPLPKALHFESVAPSDLIVSARWRCCW